MDYKEKLEVAKSLVRIELSIYAIIEMLSSKKTSEEIKQRVLNTVDVIFEEENEKIKKEYENE